MLHLVPEVEGKLWTPFHFFFTSPALCLRIKLYQNPWTHDSKPRRLSPFGVWTWFCPAMQILNAINLSYHNILRYLKYSIHPHLSCWRFIVHFITEVLRGKDLYGSLWWRPSGHHRGKTHVCLGNPRMNMWTKVSVLRENLLSTFKFS